MNDFIGLYENVLSKDNCQYIIDEFEKFVSLNQPNTIHRGQDHFKTKLKRLDTSFFAHFYHKDITIMVNQALQSSLNKYYDEFFVISGIHLNSNEVKIQKTEPKGGYHEFHCEADNPLVCNRILAWTLYLNDIPEGEGETEFLWQATKIKPKAGLLCIFPAGFTHTHRGNPVYSTSKYIATGWFTIAP